MLRTAFVLLLCSIAACAESASVSELGVHADFSADQAVADLGVERDLHLPEDGLSMCDMGAPPDGGGPERLFVAATTTGGAPYAAVRAAGAWTSLPTAGGGMLAAVGAEYADRPMILARQTDDGLTSTLFDACVGAFPSPAPLFAVAFTAERPAVVGGSAVDVIFRGSISGDQRLYATRYAGAWQAATTLGNFLSVLPPLALRDGGDLHAIFTGTDGTLYDGVVNTSGGAATPIGGASSDRGPAAAITSDGTTYVVWKATDTNLRWSAHAPNGAYATPKGLCDGQTSCLIASDEQPVVSLDRTGAPVAAWIGKGDGIVYTSRLDVGSGTWSAALAASSESTTILPALAPGLSDAELEVVYVRASDGQGRHARKLTGTFTTNDLPSGALGSRPTIVRIGQ